MQHNAIPVFVQLLQTTDSKDVLEQSVWALGNIAGDTTETRNMALNAGIMGPLLAVIQNALNSPSLLRNAVWSLSNLCRGKPAPPWGSVVDCIPVLAGLLRSIQNDSEVIADSLWSLSYLSDGPNNHIDVVLQSGIVPRVVELLASPSSTPAIQTPALRTLGNIVTGNDIQTQAVLQANILPALVSLLRSNPKASLVKEACWTISNITAGNPDQIQAVIYSGLIPLVIDILENGEFKARKEACWAISNATSSKSTRPDQIRYLVSENCIPPLCDILSCQDNKILQVALEALDAILEVGERDFLASGGSIGDCQPYALQVEESGGLDRIYELQGHENVHIYEKAKSILEKYFSEGDDALLEGA